MLRNFRLQGFRPAASDFLFLSFEMTLYCEGRLRFLPDPTKIAGVIPLRGIVGVVSIVKISAVKNACFPSSIPSTHTGQFTKPVTLAPGDLMLQAFEGTCTHVHIPPHTPLK